MAIVAESNREDPSGIPLGAAAREPWWLLACLVGIVCAGACLRCLQAGESLWLDELHTSWVVSDTLADVASRARAGNQSPLYFYLVWGVVRICGHSEWALRLISLASGSALIGVAAWLVRRWSGSVASALTAALLVALHTDCIFFAQEARPYALVQLSAALHGAVFVEVLRKPTRGRRVLFVAGAAWLFYLHYTTFLLLIAQAVCGAVLLGRGRPHVGSSARAVLWDAAWIALLFVPAAPHVLAIAGRRDNWTRIVQAWPPPMSLQVALVLFGAMPLGVAAWGRWRGWKRTAFTLDSVPALWAALWFLVPIALAWLATLSRLAPLCMMRYLVASLVGGIVWAALCLGLFSRRWYQGTLAGILVLSTLVTGGMIQQYRHDGRLIGDRNESWDQATQWINGRLEEIPGPVFLCAGLLEDAALKDGADSHFVDYCLFALSGIYRVQSPHLEPLPTTPFLALTDAQRHWVDQHGVLWLVVRAGPRTTDRIVAALMSEFSRGGQRFYVREQRRFGIVTIVRLGPP